MSSGANRSLLSLETNFAMNQRAHRIRINCDLGEGEIESHTHALLDRIDIANIACGIHAGRQDCLPSMIEAALRRGVQAGAHPGLPGAFGRSVIENLSTEAFRSCVAPQVDAFLAACETVGGVVDSCHFKLHGSLYHFTEANPLLAQAWIDLLRERLSSPTLIALAGGNVVCLARAQGCQAWAEGFVDRAYLENGTLVPRGTPGALIQSDKAIRARIELLKDKGQIQTIDGKLLPLQVDTLCVHGDTPQALTILDSVRDCLLS
jgi:UPF0271 protein